jgi:hypothetical protein
MVLRLSTIIQEIPLTILSLEHYVIKLLERSNLKMKKTTSMDSMNSETLRKSNLTIFNIFHRAQDFLSGEIHQNNKKVCDVFGNYMGFMDFDGKRYWDVRDTIKYDVSPLPIEKALLSDSRLRIDSSALKAGEID